MSRSICLALVVTLSLAGYNLAYSQDTQPADSAAGPASSSASTGDDVASLKTENAALKKEVADAKRTIAKLQAQLAQAGIKHQAPAAPGDQPLAVPTATEMAAAAPLTNAAPAGPQRALPLDATNAAPSNPPRALPLDATNAAMNPAAPGADAGASRSYTVVKGDSLWKIAHKMYPGDTKNGVDKIQEANKDAIGGKPLKIGQVLIIPQ